MGDKGGEEMTRNKGKNGGDNEEREAQEFFRHLEAMDS